MERRIGFNKEVSSFGLAQDTIWVPERDITPPTPGQNRNGEGMVFSPAEKYSLPAD